jgi:hypothetical protein
MHNKNKKMTAELKLKITSLLITSIGFLPLVSDAESEFSLTSGVDYSTGKYGQSQSTDIIYIPFIAKYETGNTTLKLTLPWVKITGPGDVVGGNSPIVLGSSNRPITSESGLGDIVLSATQTIAQFGESNPLQLELTGKVKFATASSSKGLGTGENDYTLEIDAYEPIINKSTTLFGDIGYKLLGDPSGFNLNNVWFASAGFAYKFNPATSVGMMTDIKKATINTSQPLKELTVFLTHKFEVNYKLQTYLTHGYTDASTDWGGGAMLVWTF